MLVKESFQLQGSVDTVWRFLCDVDMLAQCLPGVELTNRLGPNEYQGRMVVTFGPTKVRWLGNAEIAHDDATKSIHIVAKGQDDRKQSNAKATVDVAVLASPGGSLITTEAQFEIAGMLGSVASTGGPPIVRAILKDFERNLTSVMTATESTSEEAAGRVTAPAAGSRSKPSSISGARLLWLTLVAAARRSFHRRRT
jgi:carbon-monoxide dehydrogenase small subunit